MGGVFVSHAHADSEFVDGFVDIVLRLGCGVNSGELFYSSGADTGVSSGEDLASFVRAKARDATLVVALITPAFRSRPFCIAELGAAWSHVGELFPIRLPEMELDSLDGVLTGMLVRRMDDAGALDELHDRVSDAIGARTSSTTWGKYRDQWLSRAPNLLTRAAQTTPDDVTPLQVGSQVKFWHDLEDRRSEDLEPAALIRNAKSRIFLSGVGLNYLVEMQSGDIKTSLESGARVDVVLAASAAPYSRLYTPSDRTERLAEQALSLAHGRWQRFWERLPKSLQQRCGIWATEQLLTHSLGQYDSQICVSEMLLRSSGARSPAYMLEPHHRAYPVFEDEIAVLLADETSLVPAPHAR